MPFSQMRLEAAALGCKSTGDWQTVLELTKGMSQHLLSPSEIVYEAAMNMVDEAGIADISPVLLALLTRRAQQSLGSSFRKNAG